MDCQERLAQYFRDNGVAFQAMTHRIAYTAQEVAAAQDVKGKQVAKVVIVCADSKMVMLVVPAPYRIDWARLKAVLSAQDVRLAREEEFSSLFPDCHTGAMPPLGILYNVPVYVDRTLTQDPAIVFSAGTHRNTMKIAYKDYARLVRPVVADFSVLL